MSRGLLAVLAAVLVTAGACHVAAAASARATDAQELRLLVTQLPLEYEAADRTHDAAGALRIRRLTAVARQEAERLHETAAARALSRLERLLEATRVRLQPWPFVAQVDASSAAAARALGPRQPPAKDEYGRIKTSLGQLEGAVGTGDFAGAEFRLAVASAYYEAGPALRLQPVDPPLLARTRGAIDGLAQLLEGDARTSRIQNRVSDLRDDVELTAQTLGEVKTSRATIAGDAAVIVFREGLEAVLILAVLTASFVGARRHLRRPVLLGALAGLVATVATWVVAQTIVHSLSNGGLELQAITGLLAIAVLLLVTNWFFHRLYWSEWIGRFNRRRKTLERLDRTGVLSGQTFGFVLLGLTSTYREGFETVLFLQTLQVSAGTRTTMIGVGIGLVATLLVGAVTFLLQRKLPYKRMLIVTGLLIALVLAVMSGTTVHTMQGIGWVPISETPFRTPFWATTWLGLFPTWQTVAAQLGSLVFVIGSYGLARQLQLGKRRRHAARAAASL